MSVKIKRLPVAERKQMLVEGIYKILAHGDYQPMTGLLDVSGTSEEHELMLFLETPWHSVIPFPENEYRLVQFLWHATGGKWGRLKTDLEDRGGCPRITKKVFQEVVDVLWASAKDHYYPVYARDKVRKSTTKPSEWARRARLQYP